MRLKLGDDLEGYRLAEIADKKVVFTKDAARVEVLLDYFRKVDVAAPRAAPCRSDRYPRTCSRTCCYAAGFTKPAAPRQSPSSWESNSRFVIRRRGNFMAGKCTIRMAAFVSVAGVVVPLAAQQVPVPTQPGPTPGRSVPGAPRPLIQSAAGNTAAGSRARVQPPGAAPQPSPQIAPQAQQSSGLNRRRTLARRKSPTPPAPQRRFAPTQSIPSGGMISLNFNRADLVEIIHIIAQQLRLTYTIDPEVKGTVTINSAEPLRAEDLLPVFHQILRMNGAVAVRTGNLYHIMPIKDGKGSSPSRGTGQRG